MLRIVSGLIVTFDFPPAIRKAIHTTNPTDPVNGMIRKFSLMASQMNFTAPSAEGYCLRLREAAKKWTMPLVGWKQALNHFAISFEGRIQPSKLTG